MQNAMAYILLVAFPAFGAGVLLGMEIGRWLERRDDDGHGEVAE